MIISDVHPYSPKEEIKKFCDAYTELMLAMKECNNDLQEEIKALRDEHYKDEELSKMSKELDQARKDYHRGFPISEDEYNKVLEWQKNHDTSIHGNIKQYHGAIGGGYTYKFYPTSIGVLGECVCDTCSARARQYAAVAEGRYDKDRYREYMGQVNGACYFQDL